MWKRRALSLFRWSLFDCIYKDNKGMEMKEKHIHRVRRVRRVSVLHASRRTGFLDGGSGGQRGRRVNNNKARSGVVVSPRVRDRLAAIFQLWRAFQLRPASLESHLVPLAGLGDSRYVGRRSSRA